MAHGVGLGLPFGGRLPGVVGPSIPAPVFLYRRSLSDFQDTARTTPAGVGNSVRSATDIASSPHHAIRASGAVPTAASGGGLDFTGSAGAYLLSSLTLAEPLVVMVRCTYPVSQNKFLLTGASSDRMKIRFFAGDVEVRNSSDANQTFPMWAPDSTPRVIGLALNGASSVCYVAGTKNAYSSYPIGFTGAGMCIGNYYAAPAGYEAQTTITDIGVWSGAFTNDDLDTLAAYLNAAP